MTLRAYQPTHSFKKRSNIQKARGSAHKTYVQEDLSQRLCPSPLNPLCTPFPVARCSYYNLAVELTPLETFG